MQSPTLYTSLSDVVLGSDTELCVLHGLIGAAGALPLCAVKMARPSAGGSRSQPRIARPYINLSIGRLRYTSEPASDMAAGDIKQWRGASAYLEASANVEALPFTAVTSQTGSPCCGLTSIEAKPSQPPSGPCPK